MPNDAGDPGTTRLGFNKACELEDFSDPEMIGVLNEVCGYKRSVLGPEFPKGAEHRKDWEVAMAVRSLRAFGALKPDAEVLGVAAGAEDTIFHLTRHVGRVFATDMYLNPGLWQPLAPLAMLMEPAEYAPGGVDVERLVVQHMDGRKLRYLDNTFDGIFSSGSIEHFGAFTDIAAAAYEMGRVLKPGGVLALSTELCISGPPGGKGWSEDTILFSVDDMQRHIIEASGLELVDELDTRISDRSMTTMQNLGDSLTAHLTQTGGRFGRPEPVAWKAWTFPHVVLEHAGYVFGSIHLTLRKTAAYPTVANEWAKPTDAVVESIRAANRAVLKAGEDAVAAAAAAIQAAGPAERGDP
jgi:SAM-dependent methyltransferase